LDALDVRVGQEASFGRPQLPSLSFDAVYGAGMVPRGVAFVGGAASEYAFDPIITRVITDHVYDASEPDFAVAQWFPTRPVNVNRLGSRLGRGGNKGQLVLYPAQYQAGAEGEGVLRAFERIRLRIYYDDGSGGSDWQSPVIRRVELVAQEEQVQILLNVIDPAQVVGKPSGVQDVLLSLSLDGVAWSHIMPSRSGDVWSATVALPPGTTASNLSFVAQAVDGVGNVAFSSNKGDSYHGEKIKVYLPLLLVQ